MRVLIDLTCLRTAQAGVRNYTHGLITALQALAPDVEVLTSAAPVPRYGSPDRFWRKALRHGGIFFWYQVALPLVAAFRGADLLVCPEYYSPWFAPCPRMVVFYDSLFWDRTEYSTWFRVLLAVGVVAPARRGATVLTITFANRPRIAQILARPTDSIQVIYPVVEALTVHNGNHGSQVVAALGHSYLLHVGALERRKEIPLLIRAYAAARQGRKAWPRLVLAGPRSPIAALDAYELIVKEISEVGLTEAVLLPGMIPEAAMLELYANALALAFPSTAEGFGLPLIEAMANGVPVVAIDTPVTAEVAGDAALLVREGDVEGLAEALGLVVENEEVRDRLVRLGLANAARFGRERVAASLRRVISEVL